MIFVNSVSTKGIRKIFYCTFYQKIDLLWDNLYFGTFSRQVSIVHDFRLKALFHFQNIFRKNVGGQQLETLRLTEQEACELYGKIKTIKKFKKHEKHKQSFPSGNYNRTR
jgi:hypothetical protein